MTGLAEGEVVLVLAVNRVERLVPVVESQHTVYYLRIGDSTVKAPAYLAEDLVAGRRRGPDLKIEAYVEDMPQTTFCTLRVHLTNAGIVWAEDVLVGLVGPRNEGELPATEEITRSVVCLESIFDQHKRSLVPNVAGLSVQVRRVATDAHSTCLAPYEVAKVSFCIRPSGYKQLSAFGVFVMCKDVPPVWHQVIVIDSPPFSELFRANPEQSLDKSNEKRLSEERDEALRRYNASSVFAYRCEGFRPRVGRQDDERSARGPALSDVERFFKTEWVDGKIVAVPAVRD